jgi:hypothetical protein
MASSSAETIAPAAGHRLGTLPSGDEHIDISSILDGSLPNFEAVDNVGWRIQTMRGIVYEVDTAAQVSNRLADWTDLTQVKVARGLGPFMPLDSFPEFASEQDGGHIGESSISDLLVDLSSVDHSAQAAPNSEFSAVSIATPSAASPQLDFQRASDRHGGVRRDKRDSKGSKAAPTAMFADATRVVAKPRGFRTATALSIGILCGAMALASFTEPAPMGAAKLEAVQMPLLEPTQRGALQAAQKEMAKGNYMTAA